MEETGVYPNAPLKEVDFEIRFDGDFSVQRNIDIFQEKVHDHYPNLFVPVTQLGQSYGLEPYNFRTTNGDRGIFLSINKFGFYSTDYKGFDCFKKNVLNVLDIFKKLFPKINNINRIGLRYNNVILFDRSDITIPVRSIFKPAYVVGEEAQLVDFEFKNTIKDDQSFLSCLCKPIRLSHQQEGLSLDLDYYKEQFLKIDDVQVFMDKAHNKIKSFFLSIITNDYLKIMKGEE